MDYPESIYIFGVFILLTFNNLQIIFIFYVKKINKNLTLYKKILYICKKNDMKSYKSAENVYVHDRCYVVHYEHVEANIIDGYEETPEYNDIIRIERNGVDITRRLSEKARLMFDDEINK